MPRQFGPFMVASTSSVQHIQKVKKETSEREDRLAAWKREKEERKERLRKSQKLTQDQASNILKKYHRREEPSETVLDPDFSHLLVAKTASLPSRRRPQLQPRSVPTTPPDGSNDSAEGSPKVKPPPTSVSTSSGLNRQLKEEEEEEEEESSVQDDDLESSSALGKTRTVSMPNMSQKKQRRSGQPRRGSEEGEVAGGRRFKVKSKDVCALQ